MELARALDSSETRREVQAKVDAVRDAFAALLSALGYGEDTKGDAPMENEWIQAVGMMHAAACPSKVVQADKPLMMAEEVVAAVRHLEGEIDSLAKVLLEEFGGPTRSESACQMAIRVLREQRARLGPSAPEDGGRA